MGRKVAVVGAGISGLAAAWQLVNDPAGPADLMVSVFEAADTVGGKLRLDTVAGVAIDVGAESMLARRPEALALVGELRLDDRVTHPAAVGAAIVSGGRRWPLPRGTLMGVPSDIEALRGLLTDGEVDRAAAEKISRTDADVAVGDFVDGRLGRAVTDKLVEPLLAGVYAGHSRAISLEVAVPAMFAAAREGRSIVELAGRVAAAAAENATPVFASLVGGLGTLPALLADALGHRGVQVRTSTTARALRPDGAGAWVLTTGPTTDAVDEVFDAVVLATPAAPTARLLADVAPAAAASLATVDYASMAIVTIALAGPAPDVLEGSGFLVPPTEALTIKAATFSSLKWPWLARAHPDTTFLRASVGRFGEVATLQRPDADLVDLALRDLATVLGGPLPVPVDTHVQRWGGGLPQYTVGHRSRIEAARAPAAGVATCGAAYDGVGIPACIGSGRAAAREVLAHLAG
ncbi:protoporphyrinogen oxidase [Humibacillus sp. DSM 29435]|uniref:protoporphyrinogen oxidase n=1 Tax=Humibacillus sp. DSM 29435 TaxID=1869167 RepID=UPI000872FDB5|nr:protoporphyrinogen oxidase [Humibacillus sp. DSM 29435]OFE14496.1 protoporphyrinogen oxidase [Humibacillus sp. DSM 29435]